MWMCVCVCVQQKQPQLWHPSEGTSTGPKAAYRHPESATADRGQRRHQANWWEEEKVTQVVWSQVNIGNYCNICSLYSSCLLQVKTKPPFLWRTRNSTKRGTLRASAQACPSIIKPSSRTPDLWLTCPTSDQEPVSTEQYTFRRHFLGFAQHFLNQDEVLAASPLLWVGTDLQIKAKKMISFQKQFFHMEWKSQNYLHIHPWDFLQISDTFNSISYCGYNLNDFLQ